MAEGLLGGHRRDRWEGECSGNDIRPGIAAHKRAIKDAVLVRVHPVVAPVDVECAGAAGEGAATVHRAFDKVVADGVCMGGHVDGVTHDVGGRFPAVDDIVDVLVLAANLWIAGDAVGEKAFDDAEAAALGKRHQPPAEWPRRSRPWAMTVFWIVMLSIV